MKRMSLTLLVLMFLALPAFVSAQTVMDTVRYDQEIADLSVEYKNTLSIYQKESQEFNFAKAQYQQLQTLLALEEAIKENRELFVARDEALLRYFKLLRLKLFDSFGIFLQTKQERIADLDAVISNIESHLISSKEISSRDDVIAQTINFLPISTQIQEVSAQVTPLFSLGKLQSSFDKTVLLTNEIEEYLEAAELEPAEKSRKKRGIQLVKEQELEMRTILKELNGPIILDRRGNVVTSKSDSNTVFTGLSTVLSYLEEIVTN